jgi:hypothetical protein
MGVIFISNSRNNNAKAVAVRDWLRAQGYSEKFRSLAPGKRRGPWWDRPIQWVIKLTRKD